MTDVIVESGAITEEKFYIGQPGELRRDSSNNDLRLHDGSTPGGHLMMNRANSDTKYQTKSVELSGLNFLPEQRGMVVRRGAGDYRIRRLQVDENHFTIANPDGYNGNPIIALASEIIGALKFMSAIEILGVLKATGGIQGNLLGNTNGTHTGPSNGLHTGDVTGNVTGNLNGDADGNHTGGFIGDVDVRTKQFLIDDGAIAPSKINGLAAYVFANSIPVGGILMWAGAIIDIPGGFVLCDGGNGTPNLRDKFVVGAGATYAVGAAGGSATHTHAHEIEADGAHNHSLTVDGHALTIDEMPNHSHDYDTGASGSTSAAAGNGSLGTHPTTSVGGGQTHTHGLTVGADGSHDHTGNTGSASTLPPYYALAFIMRIAA